MGSLCSCFCCPVKKRKKNTEEPDEQLDVPSDQQMISDAIKDRFTVPSKQYTDEEEVHKAMGYQMTYRQLGKGAFGTVYEITRVSDARPLACKVIDLSTFECEDGADISRLVDLQNEIFTLKKVVHKNVIELYKSYIINNRCFIVMEKASGGPLDALVKPGQPLLPETTLKDWFAQIVAALKELHTRHGIAHKDLKLSNILICETDGSDGRQNKVMKLSDFGLSRVAYRKSDHKRQLIRGRKAEGTVFYFAPELLKLYIVQQARKKHKRPETEGLDMSRLGRIVTVDPFSADIYALGICLYKMTNQRHPFNAREKTLKVLYKLYFDQMDRRYNPMLRPVSPEMIDLLDAMFEPNYKTRIDIKEIPEHRWLIGCDKHFQ